jgi:hypothetical protein
MTVKEQEVRATAALENITLYVLFFTSYDKLRRQDSVTDMLNCLGWETLQSRRQIARLTMLYKLRNDLASIDSCVLQPITYSSTRSSAHAYKIPTVKCDYFKYSFIPRTLQEWNKLPSQVALSESLKSFKGDISNM